MRRAALILLAAAALAASGASAAGAPQPQRLGGAVSGTDLDFASPVALASGPDGLAVALVPRDHGLVVRRARAGRRFGAARRLPLSTRANGLTVAAGTGVAALAWTHFDATRIPQPSERAESCCRRVRAAILDHSGRLTRPRTLSAPGSSVSHILSAVRGRRVALAWIDGRGVRTSTGRRGAGFGPPATIEARGAAVLLGVALLRARPHVFYAMRSPRLQVVEAWRSGDRTRTRTLGAAAVSPYIVRGAVAPTGRLLLAIVVARPSRPSRLVVIARRPGGRLRSATVRVPRTTTAALAELAPDGRGLVVTHDRRGSLALRPVDRRGRLGRARRVSAPRRVDQMALALGSSGGVLAAEAARGSGTRSRVRVVAWPLRSGMRLGSRRDVSQPTRFSAGGLVATRDRRVAWFSGLRRATYAALVR